MRVTCQEFDRARHTSENPLNHQQVEDRDNDHLHQATKMAPGSLLDLVSALPSTDSWGPPVAKETTLNGVPYAPYSKGDKLGRMADWTDSKDRERGGRQQYGGRNYRGITLYIYI